jgi:hypothetical protein
MWISQHRWGQLDFSTIKLLINISCNARHQWLTPVVLATQEAEIRRTEVQSQPEQIDCETLFQNTLHKNRACGVAQGEGPEFKPQYCKKKKKTHVMHSQSS